MLHKRVNVLDIFHALCVGPLSSICGILSGLWVCVGGYSGMS